MKNIELKTCPNCNERIGSQDTECPYCKYIDDPKYKKHNEKLKKSKNKNKKRKSSKTKDSYKTLILIPILTYLLYLTININNWLVIVLLILLNIICMFTKKIVSLYVIIIEIIILVFKFITNIYEMSLVSNYQDLRIQILTIILGIIFIIIPKGIYILHKNKKSKK